MRAHQTYNAVVGATGITSLLLWLWNLGRKAVGAFGDAQTAADMIELIRGVPLNWTVIYFYAAVLSASLLLVNNWSAINGWRHARAQSNRKEWRYTATDAVSYISRRTYFSRSLRGNRHYVALDALIEAAKKGNVHAVGRPPGVATLSEISKRTWRTAQIKVKWERGRNNEIELDQLLLKDGNDKVLFEGIMFDSQELNSIWLPSPIPF